MSRAFTDNINCFNVSHNIFITADEKPKIMAWLSPLEPKVRHQAIRDERVDRIGNWLLDTKEFREWREWWIRSCGLVLLWGPRGWQELHQVRGTTGAEQAEDIVADWFRR